MNVALLAPTKVWKGGIGRWTERYLNVDLQGKAKLFLVDEKPIDRRESFGNRIKRNYFTELKRCHIIWSNLRKTINDNEIDVVHSCIPSAPLSMLREYICARIAKHHKIKFIVHFRCTVPNMVKNKIDLFIFKEFCKVCDGIILLNKESQNFTQRYTTHVTVVIPNFVDQDEINEHYEVRKLIKNVVYVGGVIKEKGCMDLIDVARNFDGVNFHLIGNPSDEVLNYAKKTSNVIFHGVLETEQIKQLLYDSDVFAFLSYFSGEGFSNALVEGMAAGLPCLVSRWAANEDMVENIGGMVVPIKSVNEATLALSHMDYEFRKEASKFNIEKIKNEYCDDVVTRKYLDFYQETINA